MKLEYIEEQKQKDQGITNGQPMASTIKMKMVKELLRFKLQRQKKRQEMKLPGNQEIRESETMKMRNAPYVVACGVYI